MRLSCPPLAVEGRAMIGTPPSEAAAPRMKSSCPPKPEKMRVPMESEFTWPVRSMDSAELSATMRSFWAITLGSFT